MSDWLGSTLWRVSEFDRMHDDAITHNRGGFRRATVFSTTLLAELRTLERGPASSDPVEVMSVCLRQREPVLVYLQYEEYVWPVTLFPADTLYHSPRDILCASDDGIAKLRLLAAEPPGVRPPGHWMHERIAKTELYRPLAPMLWTMALKGPRKALLPGIGGTAAYRLLRRPESDGLSTPGALGAAVERLRREGASLRHITAWPGMDLDRAARLLNALYLTANLIVTRAHPAARDEPGVFGVSKTRK